LIKYALNSVVAKKERGKEGIKEGREGGNKRWRKKQGLNVGKEERRKKGRKKEEKKDRKRCYDYISILILKTAFVNEIKSVSK